MSDLEDHIATAVALMKKLRRCGQVNVVQSKTGAFHNAFVCTRVENHSGGHTFEEVTKTIPFS
jgi:hypothetical protein